MRYVAKAKPGAVNAFVDAVRLETYTNALGCRLWRYRTADGGYPVTTRNERQVKVSHLVLVATGRPRPPGAYALHSCDTPRCLAPWHLRWGTAADNVADALSRARIVRNSLNHCVNGHTFTANNTYVSPTGHRQCRTCRIAADRRRYPARGHTPRSVRA